MGVCGGKADDAPTITRFCTFLHFLHICANEFFAVCYKKIRSICPFRSRGAALAKVVACLA